MEDKVVGVGIAYSEYLGVAVLGCFVENLSNEVSVDSVVTSHDSYIPT